MAAPVPYCADFGHSVPTQPSPRRAHRFIRVLHQSQNSDRENTPIYAHVNYRNSSYLAFSNRESDELQRFLCFPFHQRLPGTLDRVETRLSYRKQTIVPLSSRNVSPHAFGAPSGDTPHGVA